MATYGQIFMAFFRAGMLGFGGGLSAIPLMHREVVTAKGWLNEEEFADILALGNTLPGPINTKISGYIGWQIRGFWGMIVGISATVFPTAILMILLLTVLNSFKDKPWVHGMSEAAIPIAGVMIGVMAFDFLFKSKKSLGWLVTSGFIIFCAVMMQVLGIHPAIVIAVLISLALFLPVKPRKKQVKQ